MKKYLLAAAILLGMSSPALAEEVGTSHAHQCHNEFSVIKHRFDNLPYAIQQLNEKSEEGWVFAFVTSDEKHPYIFLKRKVCD